jgi:antitoxin ParD1/3/4
MYNLASEVVRDALRLNKERAWLRAAKLDQLPQEIQEGLSSGPATAWDRNEIKRKGWVQRATKTRASNDLGLQLVYTSRPPVPPAVEVFAEFLREKMSEEWPSTH